MRIEAALEWIDDTFDAAEDLGLAGVLLAVDRIAERTASFDGRVLVLQGDSHEYVVDNPLGLGNFQRVVVHGEKLPYEYLRLTVDPRGDDLFRWERVPVSDRRVTAG